MDDLKAGVYRHYKGPLYQVFMLAHDANAADLADLTVSRDALGARTVVVYMALELDQAHRGPRPAVRTYSDFFAYVCGNGDCTRFGTQKEDASLTCPVCGCSMVQRFEYLGPTWEGEH